MSSRTVIHEVDAEANSLELTTHELPFLLFDDKRPKKTLDFGSDGVICSVDSLGDLISVSIYHPQHGIAVAHPFKQFPGGEKFWDSSFVRDYRKKLMDCFDDGKSGLGLRPRGQRENIHVGYVDGRWPQISYSVDGLEIENIFYITKGDDALIVNKLTMANIRSEPCSIDIELGGNMSVHRASYGQLTEAGPIPIPPPLNRARFIDGTVSIENPNLPATLDCAFYLGNQQISLIGLSKESPEPIVFHHVEHISISPSERREITAIYRFRPSRAELNILRHLSLGISHPNASYSGFIYWDAGQKATPLDRFVIRRTLDYVLSCCCIPIGDDAICVLADHMALPLGWHRDNYWQMQFLRRVKEYGNKLFTPDKSDFWISEMDRILCGHVKWIFDRAERTKEGFWGRSYLATGAVKDRHVFQLDQQCYPLLELAEYLESSSLSPPQAKTWGRVVDDVLRFLLKRKAPEKWVFQTNETPGDDPVSMLYSFSSNVLLWYTLRKMVPHTHILGLTSPISGWISSIHHDTLEAFTTVYQDQPIFAYLCDLEGSFEIYYDANDIPSVLAPLWGFCSSDDLRWINLFKFAFSTENKRAYFANGEYGGLGSIHTPGPWPLGDAQEMLLARTLEDEERWHRAKEKAFKKMQWDGGFAEANDEITGEVISKHWFSWPGCMIGAALIEWEYR